MNKKRIIFLTISAIIFLFIVTLINGDLKLDDFVWEPWHSIVLSLPVLLIALILVIKYCKKTLKIILSSIIVILSLYTIFFNIDIERISNYQKPLFTWKTNSRSGIIENETDGRILKDKITYQGLGYRIVHEYYEDGSETAVTYDLFNRRGFGVHYIYGETGYYGGVSSWVGEYEYSEFIEPNITSLYEIEIYKENDKYFATIDMNGFQLWESLKAEVIGYEDRIDLVFEEYLKEPHNIEIEKGDVLFGLERKNSKLYTRWGILKGYDMNAKQGVPVTGFEEKQNKKI